jgi:hypothetical protein
MTWAEEDTVEIRYQATAIEDVEDLASVVVRSRVRVLCVKTLWYIVMTSCIIQLKINAFKMSLWHDRRELFCIFLVRLEWPAVVIYLRICIHMHVQFIVISGPQRYFTRLPLIWFDFHQEQNTWGQRLHTLVLPNCMCIHFYTDSYLLVN